MSADGEWLLFGKSTSYFFVRLSNLSLIDINSASPFTEKEYSLRAFNRVKHVLGTFTPSGIVEGLRSFLSTGGAHWINVI